MKKTPMILTGAVAALVLGGGSSAFAMSHQVDITVNGQHRSVRMLSGTVEDALAGQGVKIAPTDKVTPAPETPLTASTKITVEKQRPVTIVVDGASTERLTTGTTVAEALQGFELPADAEISPAPATKLSDKGTTITVATTKTVTFSGQNGQAALEVAQPTVGEAAAANLTDIDPAADRFFDPAGAPIDPAAPVQDGMSVRVERVRTSEATSTQDIPFAKKTQQDPELADGTTKVITEGVKGSKEVTTRTVTIDGRVSEQTVVSEKTTKDPVDELVATGTKKKADQPESEPAPAAAASKEPSAPAQDKASAPAPKAAAPEQDQGGTPSGDSTTCKASFYGRGDGTDGGPTASGERFNSEAMTAASKSLPLGSRIRVTNPATGQSVVVRINDRGPYVGGRCLDLSAGAFDAIGSTGSGVMTVSYQRVS